jgi:hypothetical protein
MAKTNSKKIKSSAERTAQALRSGRNKQRRIARNKSYMTGTKNPGHILGLQKRRYRRLERAFKASTGNKERQTQISKRMDELKTVVA